MNHILGKMKELCLHGVVQMSTAEIEEALNDLAKAGPSLDDSDFSKRRKIKDFGRMTICEYWYLVHPC
jgi:hypothetical protein